MIYGMKELSMRQVESDWIAGRDRTLRASDADRERMGDLLRRHHVEGRLNDDEFQERLERSLTARTFAELDELSSDLPRQLVLSGPRPLSWPVRKRLVLVTAIVAALVAVSIAVGHPVFFPAIPLLFFASRLLWWRHSGGRHRQRWLTDERLVQL
jgi:hypothetical protein